MSDLAPRIDLTQAVQAVRDQLMAATELGRNEPLRFDVGEIHMEFTVELRYDAHIKGGVKAWVFSAELTPAAKRPTPTRCRSPSSPRTPVPETAGKSAMTTKVTPPPSTG